MRAPLAAAAALLVVVACGSTTPATAQGPTAASVAVQSGDLPKGMQKCDVSGDIGSFLNKIKAKDPSTYNSTKAEWDAAQKNGATAAEVMFFTDSTANCKTVNSNLSGISSATYKLVLNFVIQFKDAATAANGYTKGQIFQVDPSQLAVGGANSGTKTGLGPNSVSLSVSISNQSFYIAVWQNKAFMVILAIVNIDTATSQKVAVAENGRIR
jgi:hypothetical protein